MSSPTVTAIMLTRGRPEMARRAVECFRSQTYSNKAIVVYDTGEEPTNGVQPGTPLLKGIPQSPSDAYWLPGDRGLTIGQLRNHAVALTGGADLIVHWDDDDWSHPRRIEHQVAHWMASGKPDVVGYSDLLFWREGMKTRSLRDKTDAGGWSKESLQRYGLTWPPEPGWRDKLSADEAWLYKAQRPNYALGTSLMYTREYWKRNPFRHLPLGPRGTGEDTEFLRNATRVAVQGSIVRPFEDDDRAEMPMLIASIHGGNSQPKDIEAAVKGGAREWTRAEGWDEYCQEMMAL